MEFHSYRDVSRRGKMERVEYEAINTLGEKVDKYANVYLPFGYDPAQKYDVLYVIHGGGGSPDAWLDCCPIKNMLDLSFLSEDSHPEIRPSKRTQPFIVVFPSYYMEDHTKHRTNGVPVVFENNQTLFFQSELRNILIPKIETAYSTYLTEPTEEGMRRSRDHRAITGFSMGGGTTWYAFLNNMDLFATFLPLSGDCWILESKGGATKTLETVKAMVEKVKESGFGKKDFRVFAGTGTKDIAYPNLTPMIEEMKNYPDLFDYSEDLSLGNLHYQVVPDAPHTYQDVYQHLYNFLPYIFQ